MTIRVGIVGTGGISRAHQFKGFQEVDVWEAQMTAFRETVKTNGPSPLPPEGVLLTNVIMDGIFRSHASRKEVAVKVPEM